MIVSSDVRIKLDAAKQLIENACALTIRMAMEDTHLHSTPITPKRPDPIGGTLRTAVTKNMVSPTLGIMKWHAPYAEYQERGYTTGPIRHYSTPGTHAHFIQEGISHAMSKIPEYLIMGGLTI